MHFIWVSMYLRDPAILRGHRSHAKVQPLCKLKGVPSFLSYFKTLSIGPVPEIEPATSRSTVKRSTDWANPAAVKNIKSNLLSLWRLTVYCQEPIFWSLHLCYNFESTFPIFLFLKLIISREKLILRTSAQSHKEIKFPLCSFAVFLGKFTSVR